MTYDSYRNLFTIFAILCAVMLAVTVLLFFKLKIIKVIGDITGSTARKAIHDIREQSTLEGSELNKAGPKNVSSDKTTDEIYNSGRLQTEPWHELQTEGVSTEKLSNVTTLLDASSETVILGSELDVQSFEVELDLTYTHTTEVID